MDTIVVDVNKAVQIEMLKLVLVVGCHDENACSNPLRVELLFIEDDVIVCEKRENARWTDGETHL